MNIGLVLSGGMAKGAYQIGALRAINEIIPKKEITHISCASVGALNGYAFATDALDLAKNLWVDICSNDSRTLISKLLRSNLLQQNIKKICDSDKKICPVLYCALLDYEHKELTYKNISPLAIENRLRYLKASVAMPIYNKSVFVEGRNYYDGAVVDNIPIYPLFNHDLDYIICIYFDDTSYNFDRPYYDNKIIKVTFPSNFIVKQSIIMTKESIEYMITCGYERTKQILLDILSDGYDNLKRIYDKIEARNRNECRSRRITGDVVVTNINKLAQKIAKRKIIL